MADVPAGFASEEEYLRWLASGENRPSPEPEDPRYSGFMGPILKQFHRMEGMAKTTVPDAVYGAGTVVDMIGAAGRYGYHKGVLGEDTTFDEQYRGKEAVQNIQKVQDTAQRRVYDNLTKKGYTPEQLADPKLQERVSAAVSGSQEVYDATTENSPTLSKYARKAQDVTHSYFDAVPVSEMTSADEATQAGVGALIPLGPIAKGIEELPTAARYVARTIEALTPGSTGPGNAAFNFGLENTINQLGRYFTDRPSIGTGDFFSGPDAQPQQVAQATPTTDRLAEQQAQLATPTEQFMPPEERQVLQASGINMPDPAQADMGIWGTLAAGAAITAAVLSGKTARIRPNVIDNTPVYPPATPPAPRPRSGPTPTTGAEPVVKESLTPTQKAKAKILNKRQPVVDKVAEATQHLPPDQRDAAIRGMERKLHGGSLQEKAAATRSASDFGILPGLKQPSNTTLRQLKDLHSSLSEAQAKMWNEVHAARTYAKQQNLEISSLNDDLQALQHQFRQSTNPQQSWQLSQEMQRIRGDIQRRQSGTENLASGMSRRDYRALENAAAADPQLRELDNAYRRIHGDIDLSQVNLKQYTDIETLRYRQAYDYAMELTTDEWANSKWWERAIGKVGRAATGRTDVFRKARGAEARIGAKVGRASKVDTPLGPVEYTEKRIRDHISYTRDNEAIKEFMRQMQGSSDWGKSLVRAHPSMTLSDFNARRPKVADDHSVFAWSDDGMVHFVRSGDPLILQGLRNNPADTIGAFEMAKRIWSWGTTGVGAPAFAPMSALNDMVGRYTKGGTAGYIHGALDRVFPNSTLAQKAFPDPTFPVKAAVRAAKDISAPLVRAFGEKIATDLANRSTLLSRMADNFPGGRQMLEAAGRNALLTYRNSMHLLGIKHGILSQPPIDATMENWSRGVSSIPDVIPPGKMNSAVKTFTSGWMHINDSIRSSTRMAVFAQRMESLNRKYNGRIPKTELDALEYDVKTFAGDMSRAPASSGVAKTVNVAPFGLNVVNSTAQFMTAMRADPVGMGMRVTTGIAIPWAGMVTLISHPEYNGNQDRTMRWWYDELPAWQRMTSMPFPTVDYLTRAAQAIANGEKPSPLLPEDIYLWKPFPEITPYMASVLSMAQSLGLFGSYAEMVQNPMSEAKDIAVQAFIPPTSPVFAMLNIGLDQHAEKAHDDLSDPWFGEEARDLAKAIFGTGADVANSAATAAVGAYEHNGLADAFKKGAQYAGYEIERRLPAVGGSGAGLFYNGTRKYYAANEQRQRVLNAYDTVQPLYDKLGKDKRAARLEFPEDALKDPQALAMARMIRSTMYSGMMNVLRKHRSDISTNIEDLDEKRGRYNPAQYHKLMRKYNEEMNDVNDQQEKIIRDLDFKLFNAYGTDIAGAVDYASQFVE